MRALVSFTLKRNLRPNMRRSRLMAIRRSQLVQVDWLVSYPLECRDRCKLRKKNTFSNMIFKFRMRGKFAHVFFVRRTV